MNKTILLFILALSLVGTVNLSLSEHSLNYPFMECDFPTETHIISIVPGEFRFNVSELELTKDTCFKLTFVNSENIDHDLTVIDDEDDEWIYMEAINDSTDDGLDWVYGFPENLTTAEEQGQGVATHFYLTPETGNHSFIATCEVPGHSELGETFKVLIDFSIVTDLPDTNSESSNDENSNKSSSDNVNSSGFQGLTVSMIGVLVVLTYIKNKRNK